MKWALSEHIAKKYENDIEHFTMNENVVRKGKLFSAVIRFLSTSFSPKWELSQNFYDIDVIISDPGSGENLPEPKPTGVLKKTNRYRSRSLSASSTDSYSSSCTGSGSDDSDSSPRDKEQKNSKGNLLLIVQILA